MAPTCPPYAFRVAHRASRRARRLIVLATKANCITPIPSWATRPDDVRLGPAPAHRAAWAGYARRASRCQSMRYVIRWLWRHRRTPTWRHRTMALPLSRLAMAQLRQQQSAPSCSHGNCWRCALWAPLRRVPIRCEVSGRGVQCASSTAMRGSKRRSSIYKAINTI